MSTGFITPSLPQGLSSLALRISSFCAKGTRSNSNSTPKSPRATMSASDFAMMPSMLVKASLWGQKGVWVRRLGEDLKILGPAPSPFRTNKLWKVTFLHGFLYQKNFKHLQSASCRVSGVHTCGFSILGQIFGRLSWAQSIKVRHIGNVNETMKFHLEILKT